MGTVVSAGIGIGSLAIQSQQHREQQALQAENEQFLKEQRELTRLQIKSYQPAEPPMKNSLSKIPTPTNMGGYNNPVMSSVRTRQMIRNNNPIVQSPTNTMNQQPIISPTPSLMRAYNEASALPRSMIFPPSASSVYQTLERPNAPRATTTLGNMSKNFFKRAKTIVKRGRDAVWQKFATRKGNNYNDDHTPLLEDDDNDMEMRDFTRSFAEQHRSSMSRNQFERLAAFGRNIRHPPSRAQMWQNMKDFASRNKRPLTVAGVVLGTALAGTIASVPAMIKSRYNENGPLTVTDTPAVYGAGGYTGGGEEEEEEEGEVMALEPTAVVVVDSIFH